MFGVLGGVRASIDDTPVELRGQVRQLLGVLLASPRQPVSTSVIIDRLWPDLPPRTANKAVQVIVGRLRGALEPNRRAGDASRFVITSVDGYQLDGGPDDLEQYEGLVRLARVATGAAPETALRLVEDALRIWQSPWGEQGLEPWLSPRVSALEEQHRGLEDLWAELIVRTGRAGDTIDRLRAAAEREPLREQRWYQLMLALRRDGRPAEALRTYEDARTVLRAELGVDPALELQRLQREIARNEPPAPRSRLVLPAAATSFVGRVDELAWLTDSLERSRLIAVIGIGGIGKTRLVNEFAQQRRLIGDDVRTVSFGALPEDGWVASHLAAGLGLFAETATSAGAIDVVAAALGQQDVLLVLDAVERVSSAAASTALQLIERCPRLRIVATSRLPLGVTGECTLALQPLPARGPDGDTRGTGLELLMDRAGIASASLDNERLASLELHCEAAAGVPLLIELSAATVALAEPVHPATALDHEGRVRASVEQAMEWVDDAACAVICDSAVLPGGLSVETAAALCGTQAVNARHALRQLTWVQLVTTRAGLSSVRYHSLDPVREVLFENSAPSARADALQRATDAVEAVFHSIQPDPHRAHDAARLDVAEDEHENLLCLLADRCAVDPQRALELAIAGSLFWPVRGQTLRGRQWLETTIAAAEPQHELSWRATIAVARTTRHFGEIAQLRARLEAVVAEMRHESRDSAVYVPALVYLAIAAGWSGDRAAAKELLAEAKALTDAIDAPWAHAEIGRLQALSLALDGNFRRARELQRLYARRLQELGDDISAGNGFFLAAAIGDIAGDDDVMDDVRTAQDLATKVRDVNKLGQLLLLRARAVKRSGDPQGREILAQAAAQLDQLGGVRAAALARRDLGLLELADNHNVAAREWLREALPTLLQLDRGAAALAVGGLAVLAYRDGKRERAWVLAEATAAFRNLDSFEAADDTRQLVSLLDDIGYDASAPNVAPPVDDSTVLELASAP